MVVATEMGQPVVVYPSLARTATPTPEVVIAPKGAQGLILFVNAIAISATPSVVFNIDIYDPVGAAAVPGVILASTAVTAISTRVLRVHPQLTASANLIAKDMVPGAFRVNPVHGDADSITYYVVAFFSF